MDIAVAFGIIMLIWEISLFVIRMIVKVVCYMIAFMIALVIYAVSFLLNVFTVPLFIIVHVAQKRRGRQLPYVGRWLLIFYPTFTDLKGTEEPREVDQPVKVLVVQSDYLLEDPLFWSY